MTIFLMILKIIGWIILIALLVLLALILLILFFPVTYRIKGSIHDKKTIGRVRFSWLFRIINFHMVYEDDMTMYLRLFGIRKNLSNEKEAQTDSTEEEAVEDKAADERVVPEADEQFQSELPPHDEKTALQNEELFENASDSSNNESGSKKRDTISKIRDKIHYIKDTIQRIRAMANDTQNRAAVAHVKEEIIRLLKCVMPRKLSLNASYSTGAPDTTAQVFGILAMFPIGYQNRWSIYPDFEADAAYVDGKTDIRGHIFFYKILTVGIRVIADKNIRRLIKQWNQRS